MLFFYCYFLLSLKLCCRNIRLTISPSINRPVSVACLDYIKSTTSSSYLKHTAHGTTSIAMTLDFRILPFLINFIKRPSLAANVAYTEIIVLGSPFSNSTLSSIENRNQFVKLLIRLVVKLSKIYMCSLHNILATMTHEFIRKLWGTIWISAHPILLRGCV